MASPGMLGSNLCPKDHTWVDTKWRKFFTKYNYRFLLDVIITMIATFSAKAIIAIIAMIANIVSTK